MIAISACLVLAIMSSGVIAAEEHWEPFTVGAGQRSLEIELLWTDASGFAMEIRLPGVWVQDQEEGGKSYKRLWLPSCGRTADIGLPEMPYVGRFFAIPHGATVTATVTPLDSLYLEGFRVWPAQEALPDGEPQVSDFQKDEQFYDTDALFPAPLCRVSNPMVVRGCEMALLGVFPVRYRPRQQTVTVYHKMRVEIHFAGGDGQFVDQRLRSRFFEPLLEGLLVNYPSLGGSMPLGEVRSGEGEMIILAPDAMYSAAAPLAEWRTQSGLPTVLKKLSEVGDQATDIEQYVRNAYDTWDTPPSFLLLIGDSNLMATNYRTHHPWQMNMTAADLYYCTVDGPDLFADIHYGRISVNNPSQLTNILDKILGYDKDLLSGDWNSHVFLASYEEIGKYFHITSNKIYNYLVSIGYDCDRAYEDGYPPGSTADIINNFNEGCFVINHRDHGGRENWVHPSFWTDDFWQLNNGPMLPLVFSINCLSGYFDAETDETPGTFECFCEELLRLEDDGAVGIIGSSRTSYSGYNDELNVGLYDAIWPGFDPAYPGGLSDNPWGSPIYRPGGILNFGKWYMYDKYVLTGGAGYPWPPEPWQTKLQMEMYHYHGDPSQDIHTAEPTQLLASHDACVPVGGTTFTVIVENAENALVALSVDGELFGRALVSGGSAEITFDEPLAEPGIMDVVVSDHNRVPYEGHVKITPTNGWFVVVDSVMATDFCGHVDGVVEQGDSVALKLRLRNIGGFEAPDVTGILSSSDNAVAIVDNMEAYGVIPADGKVTCPGSYIFAIAGGVPDQHEAAFDVEITSGDSVWTRHFGVTINAPVLEYAGLVMDDAGGNGHLDPGETVDLWVTIHNDGSGTGSSIYTELSTSDPFVTMVAATSSYPNIEPSGSAPNQTAFRITLDSGCPEPTVIPMALTLDAFGPMETEIGFSIPVSQKTVLVVDSDSEETEARLFDAMAQVGYEYDSWSIPAKGSVPLDTLSLYEVIVWTAGDNNEYSMLDTDRANMSEYLSQGGALLFSAENYLTSYGSDPFTSNYLHIEEYTIGIMVNMVRGVADDPITDGMDIYTNFPQDLSVTPDAIVPDSEAAGIFTVGGSSQFTALRYPNAGSAPFRVIFLATPFEALAPGQPDPDNPKTFLKNALDWLLLSVDHTAPLQITDLSLGIDGSPDDVVLTWSVPWDNVGVHHYFVYRDTRAYFEPDTGTLEATAYGTIWTDVGAGGDPEVNHYYLVTGVDAAENESLPSNRVGEQDFEVLGSSP